MILSWSRLEVSKLDMYSTCLAESLRIMAIHKCFVGTATAGALLSVKGQVVQTRLQHVGGLLVLSSWINESVTVFAWARTTPGPEHIHFSRELHFYVYSYTQLTYQIQQSKFTPEGNHQHWVTSCTTSVMITASQWLSQSTNLYICTQRALHWFLTLPLLLVLTLKQDLEWSQAGHEIPLNMWIGPCPSHIRYELFEYSWSFHCSSECRYFVLFT